MSLPLAVATGPAGVVLDLFLVLLAAKLGDELFKRLGQPTIVGEILAGVVIGPSLLGLVEPGEVLEVFAELGVVFLLIVAGIGNAAGVVDERLFAVIVGMSILTTLVVPPLLRRSYG